MIGVESLFQRVTPGGASRAAASTAWGNPAAGPGQLDSKICPTKAAHVKVMESFG
jgi:hypothetical protein